MNWDIVTLPTIIIFMVILWFQRKTILELEQEVWDLEQTYKQDTGKVYVPKSRIDIINWD